MESTDLGKRDDLSEATVVHGSRLGRILLERQMRSRTVVVPHVVREDPCEVLLVPRLTRVSEILNGCGQDGVLGRHRSRRSRDLPRRVPRKTGWCPQVLLSEGGVTLG